MAIIIKTRPFQPLAVILKVAESLLQRLDRILKISSDVETVYSYIVSKVMQSAGSLPRPTIMPDA
jgi:hypothetical protein